MKKKIFIAALIIAAILLGFLREYIFVSINQLIEHGSDAAGLCPYGRGKLSALKWVLTFVFCILYFINTSALLYVIFQSGRYIWMVALTYTVLFTVSFFAAAFGYFISSFSATGGPAFGWENVYPFIRTVMGIAQSPVVIMFLVPACFLNEAITRKGS